MSIVFKTTVSFLVGWYKEETLLLVLHFVLRFSCIRNFALYYTKAIQRQNLKSRKKMKISKILIMKKNPPLFFFFFSKKSQI